MAELLVGCVIGVRVCDFFFQAEDGIREPLWSRGLGDVYKSLGLTDNICGSNGCPNSNATWADNITSKWASDEPNRNGASCGYIWQTSGTWDDIACGGSKYAIIEFDL